MKRMLAVLAALATIGLAEDVYEIRELYNSVIESIGNSELYITELTINSEGMMYPALGTYERSFKFYWGLNEENYPESQLLFITANSQYAAVPEYEEYLFNRIGELAFHFRQGGYEQNEERFYFLGDSLIRYILDEESTDRPESEACDVGQLVRLESAKLFDSFMLIH